MIRYKEFGPKIRKLRKSEDLTQLQLGKCVGLSGPYISLIERGVVSPSLANLAKIIKFFREKVGDERFREVMGVDIFLLNPTLHSLGKRL